jgi:hypothetical protein
VQGLPRAVRVLDNADAGAPEGVRALDGDGRQLVFRHGGLQVELMLQTSRPGPVLWGKLFEAGSGAPCAGACVTLLDRPEQGSGECSADAWGEFCLSVKGSLGGVLRVTFGDEAFVCWLGDGGSRAPAVPTEAGTRRW